ALAHGVEDVAERLLPEEAGQRAALVEAEVDGDFGALDRVPDGLEEEVVQDRVQLGRVAAQRRQVLQVAGANQARQQRLQLTPEPAADAPARRRVERVRDAVAAGER